MIRVHIKNAQSVETNFLDFQNDAEADAYIAEVSANSHWGKIAYEEEVVPAVKDDQGNVITPAQFVHHETEVVFTKEDITAQVTLDGRIRGLALSGMEDAEVCAKCTALIGGYNKEKNLSSAQIQALISQFSSINFCLSNKMPRSAKGLIAAMVTDEYSEELKVLLLEVLKEF
jgi:hypothetical protein